MLAPGKHDDWKIRCALQHAQNDILFSVMRLPDKLEGTSKNYHLLREYTRKR